MVKYFPADELRLACYTVVLLCERIFSFTVTSDNLSHGQQIVSSPVHPTVFSSPEQEFRSARLSGYSKETEAPYTDQDAESTLKPSESCLLTAVQLHSKSHGACSQCFVTDDVERGAKSVEGTLSNSRHVAIELSCLSQYHPRPNHPDDPKPEVQNESAVVDPRSKEGRGGVSSSSTFLQATLHGINVLTGIGALSTPYVLSNGGWLALIFLAGFYVICLYTGILLRRCLDSHSAIKTYTDIGQAAFGWKGRALIAVLLYMELYCTAVEYIILEGDHLASLRPMSDMKIGGWFITQQKFYLLVFALSVLPTMFVRNVRLLSYFSAGGVFAAVAIVSSVGYVGAFDGVGFHKSGTFVHIAGLPVALGVFAFCYSGHSLFPSIYGSMKCRQDFSKVLVVSFSLVTILFAAIAVMGYTMFGDEVQSQVTLNLPKHHLSSRIAICITLVTLFTKYSVTLTPLAVTLEKRLPWSWESPQFLFWGTVIRTALVASTAAVALVVPFFGYIMAFVGSLLSMSTAIILPCVCYLRLFGGGGFIPRGEFLTMVVLVVFGVVAAILGTYSAAKGIVESLHH